MEETIQKTEGMEKKDNCWLNDYARNVTSQHGEDGILEKIFELIGEGAGWCVEFGSWDGRHLSNSYNLITNHGYSAVLIEGNKKRSQVLAENFKDNNKVTTLNALVGFDEDNNLDLILEQTAIPERFDLLSIDIDGNDYHVWQAVTKYRPKVVVIEFNPTIGNTVEFVQARDMTVTQGSSLLSLSLLGKEKGYELVCATSANGIFVDKAYFSLFGIEENAVETLYPDQSSVTHIFCGFDGTVFLRGHRVLPWQAIDYKESRVQQIPSWARLRFGDRNILRKKLGKLYRQWRQNKKLLEPRDP